MELFDKVKGGLGRRKEDSTQPITAQNFEQLRQILEKESAGVVCVHPWKNIKLNENQEQVMEYGLDYFSQGLSGKDIFFQEKFGKYPFSEDLQLTNIVTAIGRTRLLHDVMHIDCYVTTKKGYLAPALDPDGYPKIVEDAKTKGVKPWPLPIPKAYT